MDNEVDRVSNLPEALIHHILSFLDMKFVVQTSILSRRWRYVWTTVSTVVFSVNEFANPGTVLRSIEMNEFTRFIDKVLLLRGMYDIQKFHLHWVDNVFDTYTIRELLKNHLNTWILVSLSRNVQELLIQIDTADNYQYLEIRFPHCLFNSQSLRKLVLDMTSEMQSCVFLPNSMDLPRLKSLSLSSFYIEDVNLINKLISSCPVLESLVLRDVWIQNDNDMNVSIESCELKHLEIISNSELCDPNYNMVKTIRLSAPRLISFTCSAFMVQKYCLENLSSIVTATIQMTQEGSSWHKMYPKRMMEFVRGLHNVKELTVLLPDFVQVLGGSPISIELQSSPQFCNLRCLKLETSFTRGCLRALIYLLKTSPSVEYLFLERYESGLIDADDDGELGLSLPCLMFHLKHVEIREVWGCEDELKFLEFLLKNAIVLEKIVLSFNKNDFVRRVECSPETTGSADILQLMKKFEEKLRTLPRASPNLTMIFL